MKNNETNNCKVAIQDLELIIFTLQKLSESLKDMMIIYEEYLSEEWQFDNAEECISLLQETIKTKGEKQ